MDDEADPATSTLEQALFWRNIYTEIVIMEEAVLERIHQLMADQSPQAQREVELTNVPVVVSGKPGARLSIELVGVAAFVTPLKTS
jgi:hypothetical protein